jgi:hypothetical protein
MRLALFAAVALALVGAAAQADPPHHPPPPPPHHKAILVLHHPAPHSMLPVCHHGSKLCGHACISDRLMCHK